MHSHQFTSHAASGVQEKPAKTTRKAGREKRSAKQVEQQTQALRNAVGNKSFANYPAILEGFAAKGIAIDDIRPRENVFTFNAWKALGRVVRRGEHGVRIATVIDCTKKDEETGAEIQVRKPKATTVFHVSQTDPLPGLTEH